MAILVDEEKLRGLVSRLLRRQYEAYPYNVPDEVDVFIEECKKTS